MAYLCDKVAYKDRKTAHTALRNILSKGKRLRAYKCPNCYKYHLTSNAHNKYGQTMGYKPNSTR